MERMRIVAKNAWGFTLEHEGKVICLPLLKGGGIMISQHNVILRENVGAVIRTGDYPFYVDTDGESHIIMYDSELAKQVMECMVNAIRVNQ
jgi:hypothetical protein